MDRNIASRRCRAASSVALRKESVDRNYTIVMVGLLMCVALRKESVDRNDVLAISAVLELMSLSARRAWIEMCKGHHRQKTRYCRSPQGERG